MTDHPAVIGLRSGERWSRSTHPKLALDAQRQPALF